MSTVIDELIVVLGLDARQFTEGQRDALASFKKSKEGIQEFGKDVEQQGMKLSEVFGVVRKGALGIVAAFTGNEVVQFVQRIAEMDAATGRFAKTINTGVPGLSLWENIVQRIGGNAGSATSTLVGLQKALNAARDTGEISPWLKYFAANTGFQVLGGTGSSSELLERIQKYLQEEIGAGRMRPDQAASRLGNLGVDSDVINALIDPMFNKIKESAEKAGLASGLSAEEGQKLVEVQRELGQSWNNLGRILLLNIGPVLTGVLNMLIKFVRSFGDNNFVAGLTGTKWKPPAEAPTIDLSTGEASGRSSSQAREQWIRQFSTYLGIDPNTAVAVAKSEGFDHYKSTIPGEQSFGDFQLNMKKGNLGDLYQRYTGKDPRDPANERDMDAFALRDAAKNGWGAFHGAANTGIGNWQGIGARGAASMRSGAGGRTSTSSNQVNINTMNINAPNATDANGVAKGAQKAFETYGLIGPLEGAQH
jgi:hypothetical protein